jgi:hypothetical protein
MATERRTLPIYAWVGLLAMIVSEAGMLARVQPFFSWHTPTAWTGYILFVDGLVWRRRGDSLIRNAPAEFLFLVFASVPLWLVFEMYNKCCLQNWYYIGLPEWRPLRYFGYVWSFATIWPAMFETGELVSALRDRRAPRTRADPHPARRLGALGSVSVLAGLVMLITPLLFPSPYLAAPVWLGFFLLLDPLNARAAEESIIGDWREGHRGRLVNLLAAGLVCGVVWEFWNYWAGTKWFYNVPILPNIRIFEMPILGYGGFPAFALECFAMYIAVRRWLWRGARRPISV